MWQMVIALLVVSMACIYAIWRIYQTLRHHDDPCQGCVGCALKTEKRLEKQKKEGCWHKK